jgi:hypothetical protein
MPNDGKVFSAGVKAKYNLPTKKLSEIHALFHGTGFDWGSAWTRLAWLED